MTAHPVPTYGRPVTVELGTPAAWSSRDWHAGRDRAAHLEQPDHRPRLEHTARLVVELDVELWRPAGPTVDTVIDLGAGDGGLLDHLARLRRPRLVAYGYDWTPANLAGAAARGVDVFDADIEALVAERALVLEAPVAVGAAIVVLGEVLEHLASPAAVLVDLWAHDEVVAVVASSPWNETADRYSEGHRWAWNLAAYRDLIDRTSPPDVAVRSHDTVGPFQIITAVKELTP